MAPDFAIAKDVAEKSATLLKNSERRPAAAGAPTSRATASLVMGPTATATYVGGGGSAHVTPFEPITNSLAALRAAAGGGTVTTSRATTSTASSCRRPRTFRPATSARLAAAADLRQTVLRRSRAQRPRAACTGTCAPDQVDPTVDYTTQTSTLPAGTAWRWTTHFTARRRRVNAGS